MPTPIEPIEGVIPHRTPFLFIDKVIELTFDSIVCQKCITENDKYLVLTDGRDQYVSEATLIECLLQSGAYLMGVNSKKPDTSTTKRKFFIGSPLIKIGLVPEVGDTLHIKVKVTQRIGQKARLQGEILCDSKLVLEGVFMVAEK